MGAGEEILNAAADIANSAVQTLHKQSSAIKKARSRRNVSLPESHAARLKAEHGTAGPGAKASCAFSSPDRATLTLPIN
jgi:hypothetical protein